MKKGMPNLKKAEFENVEDLKKTAVDFSSNAYQELPPQLRLFATSNVSKESECLCPLRRQGIQRTTQCFMQDYLNLIGKASS